MVFGAGNIIQKEIKESRNDAKSCAVKLLGPGTVLVLTVEKELVGTGTWIMSGACHPSVRDPSRISRTHVGSKALCVHH